MQVSLLMDNNREGARSVPPPSDPALPAAEGGVLKYFTPFPHLRPSRIGLPNLDRRMSGIRIEVVWDPSRLSHLLKKGEAMARRLEGGLGGDTLYDFLDGWDPGDFLYPAYAFEHPSHVVSDPDLTLIEDGAMLASSASDARAPEDIPHLRRPPGGKRPGLFYEVMVGLRALDKQVIEGAGASTLFRGLLRTTPLGRWP